MTEDMTADRLYRLGKNYYDIRNYEKAEEYLVQAVMKGSSSGARLLFTLGESFFAAGDTEGYSHAEDCFQVLADRGNADSCRYLGLMCKNGWGREKNFRAAFDYFEEAYQLGLPMGAYEAGCLIMGAALLYDDARQTAIEWFRAAAEEGVTKAYTQIGILLCDNVPEHHGEALRYFLKGIKAGDTDAMVYASDLYLSGIGVGKNPRIAVALLHKAAEAGNTKANAILGDMYTAGEHVPKNLQLAQAFYQKAEEQRRDPL